MLDVLLHGRRVGALGAEAGSPVVSFVLDEGYLVEPARPVLGQQFEDRRRVRTFRQPSFPGQLPAFFANLLPEGALRAMVDAQKTAGGQLGMLAYLGEDLPGAVVVREAAAGAGRDRAAGIAFDEAAPFPGAVSAAETLRFSLAGVQLKFSAVRGEDERFTLPFSGLGGRWILKFGSAGFAALPENEFTVMAWAKRAGLDVPRHELIASRSIAALDPRFVALGEQVFAIERYDRLPDEKRIHQEDFAQVRGARPENKYDNASYEGLARLVGDLCGLDDLREFLRRVVFMILSGNVDAHLKNWSLVYPDPAHRSARLAPAYDLVFVTHYPRVEPLLALTLAKERSPGRITWDHFRRIERYLRAHGLEIAVEAEARAFARRALDAWSGYRALADARFTASISRHLEALPIARP